MRLETLRLRGIGDPFRDREVFLDFRNLPTGSVVAIVGPNGSGKTHLIEAMCPGALWREFPSYRDPKGKRGESLASHVHPETRDAQLVVVYQLQTGTLSVRHAIDGKRGKTESYLTTPDGQQFGPLPSYVDEELPKWVSSRALTLCGPFACQFGYDGFWRLGPTERHTVFAELLALGERQAEAEAAAERAKAAEQELTTVRADAASLAGDCTRARELDTALASGASRVTEAEAALPPAAEAVATAEGVATAARTAEATVQAEAAAAERERTRLRADRATAEREKTAAQEEAAAQAALLMEASTIRAAATRWPEIETRLSAIAARERELTAELEPLGAAIARLRAEQSPLRTDTEAAQRKRDLAAAAADQLVGATLETDWAAREMDLAAATSALADHDEATPPLEAAAAAEAERQRERETLDARRIVLEPQAAFTGRDLPECVDCPAVAGARAAAVTLASEIRPALDALPAVDGTPAADALATHRRARAAIETRRREAQAWLDEHRQALADLGAQRELAEQHADLGAAVTDLTARLSAIGTELEGYETARDTLTTERTTLTDERTGLDAEAAEVRPLAARASDIEVAETKEAAASRRADQATARIAALDANLAAVPTPDVGAAAAAATDAATKLAAAQAAHTSAQAALTTAREEQAAMQAARDALGDVVGKLAGLRIRETALVAEAADWALLAKSLGRHGIQALLVEMVGPEVSAIANDLIATCYTPRFQIHLTTTVPKKDGKGVKEVFEPRIVDAEAGRAGTRGSGGETALLDTAFRLATVIVNARRSPHRCETLWLDETTASLDDGNGPRWVAMVRRAMELGGFAHCFLVSHSREVWEQADRRIEVTPAGLQWDPPLPAAAEDADAEEAAA